MVCSDNVVDHEIIVVFLTHSLDTASDLSISNTIAYVSRELPWMQHSKVKVSESNKLKPESEEHEKVIDEYKKLSPEEQNDLFARQIVEMCKRFHVKGVERRLKDLMIYRVYKGFQVGNNTSLHTNVSNMKTGMGGKKYGRVKMKLRADTIAYVAKELPWIVPGKGPRGHVSCKKSLGE